MAEEVGNNVGYTMVPNPNQAGRQLVKCRLCNAGEANPTFSTVTLFARHCDFQDGNIMQLMDLKNAKDVIDYLLGELDFGHIIAFMQHVKQGGFHSKLEQLELWMERQKKREIIPKMSSWLPLVQHYIIFIRRGRIHFGILASRY